MSLLSLCQQIEETQLSVLIRESALLFPVIEGIHVLALALSLGTIMFVDLRLLGWAMQRTPVSAVIGQLQPWTATGFILMFGSGALLFWSEPVKCISTPAFIVKMIAIGVLGVNMLCFHLGVYRSVARWDLGALAPGRAKLAGALSLALWMVVVFAGRWTAYF